jgi:hypothetical protein
VVILLQGALRQQDKSSKNPIQERGDIRKEFSPFSFPNPEVLFSWMHYDADMSLKDADHYIA